MPRHREQRDRSSSAPCRNAPHDGSQKADSVWKAQDIGAEPSQLDKANAHTEVTGLSVPTRKTECEIVTGGLRVRRRSIWPRSLLS